MKQKIKKNEWKKEKNRGKTLNFLPVFISALSSFLSFSRGTRAIRDVISRRLSQALVLRVCYTFPVSSYSLSAGAASSPVPCCGGRSFAIAAVAVRNRRRNSRWAVRRVPYFARPANRFRPHYTSGLPERNVAIRLLQSQPRSSCYLARYKERRVNLTIRYGVIHDTRMAALCRLRNAVLVSHTRARLLHSSAMYPLTFFFYFFIEHILYCIPVLDYSTL